MYVVLWHFSNLFNSICFLQAMENDGLPENVCISCVSEINKAVSFKQKCERSEYTLRKYLHQVKQPAHQHHTTSPPVNQGDMLKYDSETETDTADNNMIDYFKNENESSGNAENNDACEMIEAESNSSSVYHQADNSDATNVIDSTTAILYQCHVCCLTFHYTVDLEKHISVQHNLNGSDGFMCDSEEQHVQKHTKEDTKSCVVPQTFPSEAEIVPVELLVNSKLTYKCTECNQNNEFQSKNDLHYHLLQSHSIKNEDGGMTTMHEEIKSSEFASVPKENTENYNINTTNDENENLDNADNSSSSTNLEAYPLEPIVMKPSEQIISKYKCIKCGASFAKKKSLNIHQKSNKCTEKAFMCHICNRVFVLLKNLTDHLNAHSAEKQFACPHCPKQYSRQDQLTLHLQNHSGIRKHTCPFCPKGEIL